MNASDTTTSRIKYTRKNITEKYPEKIAPKYYPKITLGKRYFCTAIYTYLLPASPGDNNNSHTKEPAGAIPCLIEKTVLNTFPPSTICT
jgi:hypothetical protein